MAKEFTGNAEHLHYPLETDRQHLSLARDRVLEMARGPNQQSQAHRLPETHLKLKTHQVEQETLETIHKQLNLDKLDESKTQLNTATERIHLHRGL